MPKIVDHDAQRERIAGAALRLIETAGLERTTVRAIAAEAGMSAGSMRHYLATQDDLFILALRRCSARAGARIAALPREGRLIDQLQALLEQLLPLDAERRLENEVWVAFVSRAQSRPALRAILREANDGLLLLIAVVVDVLVATGDLDAGTRRDEEAQRLLALVNGLAINALLWPETITPDRMRALVRGHLAALLRHPGAA